METPAPDVQPAPASDKDDPVIKASQAAIDAYRKDHPDAHLERMRTPVGGDDFVVGVARVPSWPEWLRIKTKSADPDPTVKASANRELVNTCLIFPVGQEFAAMLKRYPALVDTWAGEIAEMAGALKGTVREKV